MEAKFYAKVTLLCDIITGPLRFLDEVYWLQYELKCIGAVTQAKPINKSYNCNQYIQ